MPAIREHEDLPPPVDDDDDMPPLVDNPNPSMTFTFATDMTPISYSADNYGGYELPPPPDPSTMFIMSPPGSPSLGPTRPANSKRRDASHIPRPPNAFILFRSSFIKAQHIPDKIEGNHSSLSKIIGMYWKTLPREERQVWEAKAVVAQAEHRQKYPDWRFRPGNVIGKVKDGPRKRGNRKGRGDAEEEEKNRQKRCAKIARLLEEGMTGAILEDAVREYDREAGPTVETIKKERSPTRSAVQEARQGRRNNKDQIKVESGEHGFVHAGRVVKNEKACRPRAKTLAPSQDARFNVPLTDMFKRSSSVPAIATRICSPATVCSTTDTPQSPSVASPCTPCDTPATPYLHEDRTCDNQEVSPLSSPALTSLPTPEFQCNVSCLTADSVFPLPSLDPDSMDYGSPASSTTDYVQTPNLSPNTIAEDLWYTAPSALNQGPGGQPTPILSTYSSLTGWAGDALADEQRYMAMTSPPCLEFSKPAYDDFQFHSNAVNEGWLGLQHHNCGLLVTWAPVFQHTESVMSSECAVYA